MKYFKRASGGGSSLVRTVAAPLSAAALLLSLAAPAQAGESRGFNRCPVGYFCLFQHVDGTGLFVKLQGGAKHLNDFNDFGDEASAVWNRTNSRWAIYEHSGYRGERVFLAAGAFDNLADDDGSWNERVSSARKNDPRR